MNIAKPAGGPMFESAHHRTASAASHCQLCGKPTTANLCSKCEEDINRDIRAAISAAGREAARCPTCKGKGSTFVKLVVPHRDHRYGKVSYRNVEETRRCTTCFGQGFLSASRSDGADTKVVPSDVGLLKARNAWRPMSKVGQINGLPRFAGTAFATDGVLVAIRLLDGTTTIGHLDSFIVAAEPKVREPRLGKLAKLMLEFS